MKLEVKQTLERMLDTSYKAISRDGSDKAIGAVRCITGLTQGDQGFVHIENIYIRGNTIQLGAHLNNIDNDISNIRLDVSKNNLDCQNRLNDILVSIQDMDNRLKELERFVVELTKSQID